MGPCDQDRGAELKEDWRRDKCLSHSIPGQEEYFFVLQSTQKSELRLIFFEQASYLRTPVVSAYFICNWTCSKSISCDEPVQLTDQAENDL